MLKKIIGFTGCVAMTLAFTGCPAEESSTSTPDPAAVTDEAKKAGEDMKKEGEAAADDAAKAAEEAKKSE